MNIYIVLLCFALFSCQKNKSFSYLEWQKGHELSANAVLKNIETEEPKGTTQFKNKKIQFLRQRLNGKVVFNSFVKKITLDNSDVELIQAQVIDEKTLPVIKNTSPVNFDFLSRLKKVQPSFDKIEIISNEDSYVFEDGSARNYRIISFFDRYGVPYLSFFKPDGEFVRIKRTGTQFSDVSTMVFTEGPKFSELSEQLIKNLNSNPSLSNSSIFVTSMADKKIDNITSNLKFDPKDERFDQIQAFYYMNKYFQWMKDHLQIVIPQRVDAVVHMGFPEKTNTAFYYQNKIRFGKGDDVVYANIVSDPSIVYHETFHVLIDNLAGLPFEGEGGSINEGFADFFTCLITDRPYLGESSYLKAAFRRNLKTVTKLTDKNSGLYHDSIIVSGLLWEVKEKFGLEKAKNLAAETLVRLNLLSQFADFNKKILEAASVVLNLEEQLILNQILKARGFSNE